MEGVWQTLSWTNSSVHAQLGDFTNLFASFLPVEEDYRAEVFILTTWDLWNRRNAAHLNHPTHPLDQILLVAGGLPQDFINTQIGSSIQLPITHQWHPPDQLPITHQWHPPNQPQFKANFDGAVLGNINVAGIGVVIRDFKGDVISVLSRRIPLPRTMEEVEALACHQVVQYACEIGIHEVIFKGNSSIVVQALKHGQADQSVYGHILDDVIQHTSQLRFCDFCHVPRTCNKVADFLAKKDRAGLIFQVWLEAFPRELISFVFADTVLS